MQYFKGLIFGDTGTGKTWFGGTLSALGKVAYLHADLSSPDTLALVPGERVLRFISTPDDAARALKALRSKPEYAGAVFDGMTGFIQNTRDSLTGSRIDAVIRATQPMWGDVKEIARLFIKDFVALPMHIMLIALAQRDLDFLEPYKLDAMGEIARDKHGEPYPQYQVLPSLETKLRHEIGGQLNAVGYTFTRSRLKGVEYHLSFQKAGVDTKLCGCSIPDMVDPTFEKVWQIISKKEETNARVPVP